MTWQFGQALNGNIAVMGEIDVAAHREFTIAIGLGDGHHAALREMMQALATPYEEHCERFMRAVAAGDDAARSWLPASSDGGTADRGSATT